MIVGLDRSEESPWPGRPAGMLRLLELATEVLLYGLVCFSPWAFGATQDWAVRWMNGGCYGLAILWLAQLGWARWTRQVRPRWIPAVAGRSRGPRWWTVSLAVATVLIPAWCLVSALNARADFVYPPGRWEYFNCLRWLPHSYDRDATWELFWRLLAVCLAFWAIRDWLLVADPREANQAEAGKPPDGLPARWRRLAWVLAINASLIAIEGIIQRRMGQPKLLWKIKPVLRPSPKAHFGPWAYRSNAAQYFLLAWPWILGVWAALHRHALRWPAGMRRHQHHLLLPCVALMAVVPLVSLSRAGAILGVASLLATLGCLVLGLWWNRHFLAGGGVLLLGLMVGWAGYRLEWNRLARRFAEPSIDSDRSVIWANTWRMVEDFGAWGIGPGTFGSVYLNYWTTPKDRGAAHVHNDWLELLVTFGWVGALAPVAGLLLVLWPAGPGRGLVGSGFLHLGTCLALFNGVAYGVVDFPLKVYSVLFLFVLLCAVHSALSSRLARGDSREGLSTCQ